MYYIILQWDKEIRIAVRTNTIPGLVIKLKEYGICSDEKILKGLFNENSNVYLGKTNLDEDLYVCEILGWDYIDDL